MANRVKRCNINASPPNNVNKIPITKHITNPLMRVE